jgi:hypothetical protein
MKVTKLKTGTDGSCNYCDKGKLSLGGTNLIYPYDHVYKVEGRYIASNFCEECLKELMDYKID